MEVNNVTNIEEWKEELEALKKDYQDLYNDLIDSGKTLSEALNIVRHVKRQEPEYDETVYDIDIQVSFLLEDLEKYGYKGKDIKGKEDMLWELGMNTKTGKWATTLRRKMVGVRLEWKEVVWGGERLDKGWLTKRREDYTYYASDEARDLYRMRKDYGYKEEVRKLSF